MATKVASGNIKGAHFIKLDTTTVGRALLAGAGDKIFGVSMLGTRLPPQYNDFYLAIAGEEFGIWTWTDVPTLPTGPVPLLAGGTITVGDRLKSDANGAAVTTTTTGDELGAQAEESAIAGQIFMARLLQPAQL